MKKATLTTRMNDLEARMDNIENALNRILAAVEQPAKPATRKPATKKAPKAPKPATRAEALAKWEADKGITPESKAAYKAYYSEQYDVRWNKWVNSKERAGLKGEALKRRNREKSASIREAIKRDWEAMNA